MIFIDTNYFLRFFLKDIRNQYLTVKQLFLKSARGEAELVTSTIVIFEVYWVLRSYYNRNRVEICQTLQNILDLDFIELSERSTLQQGLNLFQQTNLSLGDCYNIIFTREHGIKSFKSFDLKLVKVFKS